MARPTTPTPTPTLTPGPNNTTTPGTPGASTSANTTRFVQRNTPLPSTPGHRHIASVPRTPGTSPLTACSSSPSAFTVVKVHTAKCSECDKRNMDVMRRCPGCTFQVCKPCQEKRERGGRSLAHGNMQSPRVATPGMEGWSVVRKRPVAVVKSGEKKETTAEQIDEKSGIKEVNSKKRVLRPGAKLKTKPKVKAKEATPSDDSSDDDFEPDPGSPTSNKRRRTGFMILKHGTPQSQKAAVGDCNRNLSSVPSTVNSFEAFMTNEVKDAISAGRSLNDMTTDEMLAHYNVNTSINPYKAHLLSRHEPVVSNPVIQIPGVVKRGFKPRPSAKEIQRNIQEKVRKKMSLPLFPAVKGSNE